MRFRTKSTGGRQLEAWNCFVLAVSWRANRLQKDDLEAKRHLKPELVMLTEVHLVTLAKCASIALPRPSCCGEAVERTRTAGHRDRHGPAVRANAEPE